MRQQQKAEKISKLKTRLELYYKREEEMLSGGVQSYGIGTRNATRYQTDLSAIRKAIKEMEDEIASLENKSQRRAVGVVPRDWEGGENHAANNSKQNTRATCSGGNTRSPSEISSPASFKLWIFRGRRKLEEKGAEKFQGQQLLPSMGYRPQQ